MNTILLVDDSASILAMLEAALSEAGYHVVTAADGRQALRVLGTGQVDLVVTDMYMPETDGIELMLALKKMPQPPSVIAMSSMTGDMDMLGSAKLFGAKKVLKKPFPAEELVQCVRCLLGAL